MTNVPPEGSGGEPGSWGSQQGGWGSQQGWGQPGGWDAGRQQAPYGQAPGQGLPSYSQYGGQQGNRPPAPEWGGQLAGWGQRAGGFIIDFVIAILPAVVLYIIGLGTHSAALDALGGLWALAFWIWFAVQSGQYGSSPGMRVMGLKLVRASTGQVIGGGMGFVRQLLHAVGWALCGLVYLLDMLWPLWDGQRQTLADKVMGTVVLRAQPEGFSLVPRSR